MTQRITAIAALTAMAALWTRRTEVDMLSTDGLLCTGRGGGTLLTLEQAQGAHKSLVTKLEAVDDSLEVLAGIADAYDANHLDDEARKHWGRNDEHTNQTPHDAIVLVSTKGGSPMLTLAHAMAARAYLDAQKAAQNAGVLNIPFLAEQG